jgi:hypothetical protein
LSTSNGKWVLAWIATLILAPILFVLCLAAWGALCREMGFLPPGGLFRELSMTAVFPKRLPLVVLIGAAMALIPSVLIGVPLSLVLAHRNTVALRHFALAGAVGGFTGGFVIVALTGGPFGPLTLMPKLEFALLGSLYGAFAMLVFRVLAGRR